MCLHGAPPSSVWTLSGSPRPRARVAYETRFLRERSETRRWPASPLSAAARDSRAPAELQQGSLFLGADFGSLPSRQPPLWGIRCTALANPAALGAFPSTARGPQENGLTSLGLILLICKMGMLVSPHFWKVHFVLFCFYKRSGFCLFVWLFLFVLFLLFRASPVAYGGSRARG